MTFWELIVAAAAERHRVAVNYDGTADPRAWPAELQRGAPSGGAVYPVGWWGAGTAHQPNAEYRHLSSDEWLIVNDQLRQP